MLVLLERLVVIALIFALIVRMIVPVFALLRLAKGLILLILLILLRFRQILLMFYLSCFFLLLFLFIIFIFIVIVVFIILVFINILFHIKILILFVIIILFSFTAFSLSFCGLRTSSSNITLLSISLLFIIRNGLDFIGLKKPTNINCSISLGDEGDLIEQRNKQIDCSMRVLLGQYRNKHLLLVLLCPQRD